MITDNTNVKSIKSKGCVRVKSKQWFRKLLERRLLIILMLLLQVFFDISYHHRQSGISDCQPYTECNQHFCGALYCFKKR